MYGKEITALIGGMDDEYIDLDVSYSIHFKMLKKLLNTAIGLIIFMK